jgi:Copper transport outer membrane protein, MctB
MVRRTVFSILATAVALAVGIALGNGPLQGRSDRGSLVSDNVSLQRRLADANGAAEYDRSLLTASTAGLIKGRLTDKVVTLVVLPGVRSTTITRTRADLEAAGAQIATTVTIGRGLVEAERKVYVESVATNTFKGVHDLEPGSTADPYQRIGSLLARAYVAKASTGSAFDKESVDIDAQLQGAKLVKTSEDPARRGNFVLVLDTGQHGGAKALEATRVIERAVLAALVEGSDGLVVAAGSGADSTGGLLQSVDADTDTALGTISTVNVLDAAGGRVTTVLALAAVAAGDTGRRYGIVRGKPALPPGLSTD